MSRGGPHRLGLSPRSFTALLAAAVFFTTLFLYLLLNRIQGNSAVHFTNDRLGKFHLFHDQRYTVDSSKLAFAMKTGSETGPSRIPILLLTYLQHLQNVLYFSDEDTQIGKLHIKGVIEKVSHLKEQGNTGWDLDQAKFIPGFHELYEQFPECDWYIMLDDDTYLYLDNLKLLLSEFNSNDDHYFGSPRSETGCDKSPYKDTHFAMGGAGVILSRSAMLKLYNNIHKCDKYRNCGYGDGSLGECMRELGILFHGNFDQMLDLFNGESPQDFFFRWPEDSCLRPITFHHVKPYDTQKLYEIDTINPSNIVVPVTYSLIYDTFGKGVNYDSTKITGQIIEAIATNDKEYCVNECLKNEQCRAWSVNKDDNSCNLLSSKLKKKKAKENYTSGFVKSYKCEKK
jgi:hypothetical protein